MPSWTNLGVILDPAVDDRTDKMADSADVVGSTGMKFANTCRSLSEQKFFDDSILAHSKFQNSNRPCSDKLGATGRHVEQKWGFRKI